MRVVMIDPANQAPFYTYPLCQALQAAGCSVELVSAPFLYDQLPAAGVHESRRFGRVALLPPFRRVQRLRQVARTIEYPFDWAGVLASIRRSRPEVVHVQWAMLPFVDGLAFAVIRRLGLRLAFTVHDVYPHYAGWRRALLSPLPLYRLADDLFVHTEEMKAKLCAVTGLPTAKVRVAGYGCQMGWSGPPVAQAVARARLGLPEKGPLVLFFGSIKPYKRLDLVLEALPAVVQRLPGARLLIAGRSEESFGPYRRIVDRLGLAGQVIERLGYVPERELPAYFGAADVVVVAHAEADFSASVLAASTYGRPVVATATSGLKSLIVHGETGYLTPADDRQALAEALVRLLEQPELASQMGSRAREQALARYDWNETARIVLEAYQRR
jgi:D-inositol-3-phosphate glycosyltransferase